MLRMRCRHTGTMAAARNGCHHRDFAWNIGFVTMRKASAAGRGCLVTAESRVENLQTTPASRIRTVWCRARWQVQSLICPKVCVVAIHPHNGILDTSGVCGEPRRQLLVPSAPRPAVHFARHHRAVPDFLIPDRRSGCGAIYLSTVCFHRPHVGVHLLVLEELEARRI
jgi:hypothetical protein